jgi:LuxR family transcriptional regulator, maltose regulon positive regulatory protein
MSVSSPSQRPVAPWISVAHEIISGDPIDTLDRLANAARFAEDARDPASHAALCANVLAFMLLDWARFTDWRQWAERFETSNALLQPSDDVDLRRARVMGTMVVALFRGDALELLRPLGEELERLFDLPSDPVQMSLAAAALLPWLQMSRNAAVAQTLHANMSALVKRWPSDAIGACYVRGAWPAGWAQHTYNTDQTGFPNAFEQCREYLAASPSPQLQFRLARLTVQRRTQQTDNEGTERALRDMLAAIHPNRPLERATYNLSVTAFAAASGDFDRAMLHATHISRDLQAADCPPSIATTFRMAESRAYLGAADYEKAIPVFEACIAHAHTAHAEVYAGFAALSRALHLHQRWLLNGADISGTAESQNELLREHLSAGLGAIRRRAMHNFFFTAPVARATTCALALREGIEVDFVRASIKILPTAPPVWVDERWPWAMSLRCFGGFRNVGPDSDPGAANASTGSGASKTSNRPLSLLKLIAAHGAQGVTVAFAADALWPDQDGDQAENALSVTLLRLRRMHADSDVIERTDGWLHLNVERAWTDVRAFEAHLDALPDSIDTTDGKVSAASNASNTSDAAKAVLTQYIKRLFDLYRGDCLSGVEEPWAQRRAAHYRARMVTAMQQLIQRALADELHATAQCVVTRAHALGFDAAQLFAAAQANDALAPPWQRLQQHVETLMRTENKGAPAENAALH